MLRFHAGRKKRIVLIIIAVILTIVLAILSRYVESNRDIQFGIGSFKLPAISFLGVVQAMKGLLCIIICVLDYKRGRILTYVYMGFSIFFMLAVSATSQGDFREAVRREWRVEFAFEDHRFWDVRRWDIGQSTQGRIDGVEITRSGGQFTYKRTVVENRTWSSRQNLYPIPQAELFCNPNLNPQNPGWSQTTETTE